MLFPDLKSKACKLKGLYFIVCLCSITLSKLLECWVCKNADLVLFGFQGYWEQNDNPAAAMHFPRKIFSKISVEKLIFCKSSTSLQLKWGKVPVKVGQNRGVTAPSKPLVQQVNCNELASTPKMTGQTEKPYFDPFEVFFSIVKRSSKGQNRKKGA